MLVLQRKPGESLTIGPGIEVKILRVRGNRVEVGIQAPREMQIDRVPPITEREYEDDRTDAA